VRARIDARSRRTRASISSFTIIAGVESTAVAARTPETPRTWSSTRSESVNVGSAALSTVRWALPPRILSRTSSWNPVMRARAMTSAAVPTVTPATEMIVIMDRKVRPR
jgi:hypothetical protein